MSWTSATLTDARLLWRDAPEDDDELQIVLDAAYGQCVAFAPAAPETPSVADEARFATAHVMQARALYRSATAGGGDSFGGEGFTVTVFPLDWSVKLLLRPPGRPVVA